MRKKQRFKYLYESLRDAIETTLRLYDRKISLSNGIIPWKLLTSIDVYIKETILERATCAHIRRHNPPMKLRSRLCDECLARAYSDLHT